MYFGGSLGIVVTFDKTSKESFAACESYIQDGKDCGDIRSAFIIIGNKSDLEPVVSFEQGQELAFRYEAIYIEVSSKTGENIENFFQILCNMILEFQES